ncbi:hypothetical protein SAMN02745166_03830 [Prosthecobacter debontii]|uniref:Uncharacterized protein n=1 Tax=Prosthecobacter debontii TaxID=48467 RepID=A0A1T4YNV9_9BACT|nr:hypothetical protein [Prosthecobacter debontii]SKB03517.1 hypothetical protein SAMN02745166_03830 [Prosthecobacter debontii]
MPFWLWPHVLSLEAPLVAVLWLLGISRLDHLQIMPGVVPGLGFSVWFIYLADRVLDTFGVPESALSLRHRFYRRWRWALVFIVMPAVAVYLAWLGLWVVPARLLTNSVLQLFPIGVYLILYSVASSQVRLRLLQAGLVLLLFAINALPFQENLKLVLSLIIAGAAVLLMTLRLHEQIERFFRKEVAAGILFALGCTTWSRFHDFGSTSVESWAAVLLLALLFTCNLALITAREAGPRADLRAHGTLISSLVIVAFTLIAVPLGYVPANLLPLSSAVAVGLLGLKILWFNRQRLSAEAFRVWADVVVALPALATLVWPTSSAGGSAPCCM